MLELYYMYITLTNTHGTREKGEIYKTNFEINVRSNNYLRKFFQGINYIKR